MSYLLDYIKQLKNVEAEADIYGPVLDWQLKQLNQGVQANCVAQLNQDLGFLPGSPYLLQPAHIPTTAIGSLRGLVVISANPAYDAELNRLEHDARVAGDNAAFCRYIFRTYPALLRRTIRYWTQVMGVWRLAFLPMQPHLENGHARWIRAHNEDWAIGGVDLIPFHSSKDGVTPRLGPNGHEQLREVALETLRMVCRLPAEVRDGDHMRGRLVLVASNLGNQLVNRLAANKEVVKIPWANATYGMTAYRGANDNLIISVPYQIFSRQPGGYTHAAFAAPLRDADDNLR